MVVKNYYLFKLIFGVFGLFVLILVMGTGTAMAQRGGDESGEETGNEADKPLHVVIHEKAKVEEEDDPGRHRHDGFFLRMAPGISVSHFTGNGSRDDYYDDPYVTSGGTLFDFAIGGAVADNLILHAGFWNSDAFMDVKNMRDDIEGTVDLTTLNAGMTYYFMPSNIYISASAGLAHLDFRGEYEDDDDDDGCGRDDDDDDDDDDELFHEHAFGGSAQLLIGKEWFVSDNWGLGFGGSAKYAWAQNENLKWDAGVFGLYFSATFN